MDVVLYMRYSSAGQTEQSIEGQERICRDFCRREGYTIIGVYIDRAMSAFHDIDKRSDFQRMINDSSKGLFQGIVVYKLDRFARNRYDSAIYKSKLTKNGVRLISATEHISENPEGVLLESVLEGMAEFYSKELSQKTKRGMNESAMKAHTTGSRTLGYKTASDKSIEIDPAQAEIVKTVFQMYADGISKKNIADILNANGYKSSRGKSFSGTSFETMLRNKKYIGIYHYDGIEIPGGIPRIIDDELWERVQERLSKNKAAPGSYKSSANFLLSCKIKCAECGSTMTGESATSRSGKKYYYYNCLNHKYSKGCTLKAVRKDDIERVVINETLKLLDDDMQQKIAKLVVEENQRYIAQESLVPSLEADLKECEASISNLLKLAETGVVSDSLSSRLTELEEKKKHIKTRIVDVQKDTIRITEDMVIAYLHKFIYEDENDPGFHQHLIDGLVSEVRIGSEFTEIDFAVAGKNVRILNALGRHTVTIRTPR